MTKLYSILPQALQEFEAKKLQALAGFDFSMFVNQREDSFIEDGIGYINIQGPLQRDSTPIDRELGATDYEDVKDDIEDMLEQEVEVIVFVINSPGGTVSGLVELSDIIEELPVPTIGFINDMATSAAYHLAASMTYLIAPKSATIGNIGAVMVFTDMSKLYDNMGIKFDVFTNEGATIKGLGYEPSLSLEQRNFLQDSIDETGRAFQDYVRDNRPEVDESVFNAAWYSGTKALELGLIDEIGDMSLAIEYANKLKKYRY